MEKIFACIGIRTQGTGCPGLQVTIFIFSIWDLQKILNVKTKTFSGDGGTAL